MIGSNLLQELLHRFPDLDRLSLFPGKSSNQDQSLPTFIGILLAILGSGTEGAACIVLPRRERVAFAVAVLTAVSELKVESSSLGQRLLEREFERGQLVRFAPEGYVFEYDGYFPYENNGFFRLKIPGGSIVHALRVEQAFRLSSTDRGGRRAPKSWIPSSAPGTALDELIGMETGGNTAVLPNHVLLLTTRSRAELLAESTSISQRGTQTPEGLLPAPVSQVLTWGRIDSKGKLISEDPRDAGHPPLIATTHSIEQLAAACTRSNHGTKRVIINGAARLDNLQALEEIRSCQRTLILADYTETEQVRVLHERGIFTWAPDPQWIVSGAFSTTDSPHPLLARFAQGARNAMAPQIDSIIVSFPQLERLAEDLDAIDDELRRDHADQRSLDLIGRCYGLLVRSAEWIIQPPERLRRDFTARISSIRDDFEGIRFWLSEGILERIRRCLDAIQAIGELPDPGKEKTEALLALLTEPNDSGAEGRAQAIIVRTPEYASHLRSYISDLASGVSVHPSDVPSDGQFDRIILGTWLSQQKVGRILDRFAAPAIKLIAYGFEESWFRSYRDRRAGRLSAFKPSHGALVELTGLRAFEESTPSSKTEPDLGESDGIALDPISRIMEESVRKRKGRQPAQAPESDLREARYIDFHGTFYAYFTESHSVPVVTALVLGGEIDKVPLRNLKNLEVGDYLLFREQGGHDIVSLIAQTQIGEEAYGNLMETAHRWRPALQSIGSTFNEIYSALHNVGLDKTEATVRNWLRDDAMIGPGDENDLRIIAEVSDVQGFRNQVQEVQKAIKAIRGAHIQAGFTLSKLLISELPEKVESVEAEGSLVDLTFGTGWIVCLQMISGDTEVRPYWEVNRLLSEDTL